MHEIKSQAVLFLYLFVLIEFCWATEPDLKIQGANYSIVFQIEIADTPSKKQQGLMFREHLDENSAMLFDYMEPKKVSMWMKNTFIPLDILFIDEYGIIVGIYENAKPLSETIISSKVSVRAVLEINAGLVEKNQIKIGDQVLHTIFNSKAD